MLEVEEGGIHFLKVPKKMLTVFTLSGILLADSK